jgi:RNA polymerase sigma-70 factor (ECF subfamily)
VKPDPAPFDDRALERLYQQLERSLYNVVYRWVWDREEARELVQEAFVRLWRMRARVSAETVRPLIFRIALNLAANRRRWRRLWRLAGLEQLRAVASDEAGADDSLAREQHRRALQNGVERLPERLRRVIVLCELGGMSYAEVAEVLRIPTGTVASRRNAALARLRQLLVPGRPALPRRQHELG